MRGLRARPVMRGGGGGKGVEVRLQSSGLLMMKRANVWTGKGRGTYGVGPHI